jgi:glutathione reductase (NADPH)
MILIPTGARPELPPFDGIELGITSDAVFDLKTFPSRLVIGGAGYIAMEFAGLLPHWEATSPSSAAEAMPYAALTRTCAGRSLRPTRIVASSSCFATVSAALERRDRYVGGDRAGRSDVRTEQGGRLVADHVLLAFGHSPNTISLGLDRAGVKTGADGAIIVDPSSRTNVPSIYAAGNVSNQFNLTPIAIREG